MKRPSSLALAAILVACSGPNFHDVANGKATAAFPQTWDTVRLPTHQPPLPRSSVTQAAGNPGATAQPRGRTKLAVLVLEGRAMSTDEALALTDIFRARLTRNLQGVVDVVSKEKMFEILQSAGKRAQECTSDCQIETARIIGSEFVATATVSAVGSSFSVVAQVKRTRDGTSLAAQDVLVKSKDAIVDGVTGAADKLAADFAKQFQ